MYWLWVGHSEQHCQAHTRLLQKNDSIYDVANRCDTPVSTSILWVCGRKLTWKSSRRRDGEPSLSGERQSGESRRKRKLHKRSEVRKTGIKSLRKKNSRNKSALGSFQTHSRCSSKIRNSVSQIKQNLREMVAAVIWKISVLHMYPLRYVVGYFSAPRALLLYFNSLIMSLVSWKPKARL